MKRQNAIVYGLAFFCAFLGTGIFCYKAFVLGFPVIPDETVRSWHIEAKITFDGNGKESRVRLNLPVPGKNFSVIDESFVSDGYGFYKTEDAHKRTGVWTKRNSAAHEAIFYHAVIYEAKSGTDDHDAEHRLAAVSDIVPDESARSALASIHRELTAKSVDGFSYLTSMFALLSRPEDERIRLLSVKTGHRKRPEEIGALILQNAGIPARIVNGIVLSKEKRNPEMLRRLEAYIDNRWIRLNTASGTIGTGKNFMPWWEGENALWHLTGGKNGHIELSVKRRLESALTEAVWHDGSIKELFYSLSPVSLPPDVQLMLQIMLLIPVGAFVCTFLKQFVGLSTYGTFMPVLIAVAFRETGLLWGIILFWLVIAAGTGFRRLFDGLQLLTVPRLCAILTIVVGVIFMISLVLQRLNVHSGMSVSLFPLVILTMIIERMSVTWEERGTKIALTLAFNSLVIAALCYAVISNPYVVHLTVVYPELLLLIVSGCLLLGKYNGYKLTEYYRFRALR